MAWESVTNCSLATDSGSARRIATCAIEAAESRSSCRRRESAAKAKRKMIGPRTPEREQREFRAQQRFAPGDAGRAGARRIGRSRRARRGRPKDRDQRRRDVGRAVGGRICSACTTARAATRSSLAGGLSGVIGDGRFCGCAAAAARASKGASARRRRGLQRGARGVCRGRQQGAFGLDFGRRSGRRRLGLRGEVQGVLDREHRLRYGVGG